MAKTGRNELCPCGSGKKYKRCHGSNRAGSNGEKANARAEADRVQRERQQGLGKPIISADLNGRRLVAVKNRWLGSKGWLTFHDFLFDYLRIAMGRKWGSAEIARPIEQSHPVVIWYQKICKYQRTFVKEPGKVQTAPMTGATAAYLHLAYDLYALDHNAELQDKLLARLRNHDKFTGALYEVFVAAAFIRAGFNIEFEDEDNRKTTHCEFTATYRRTGKRFSVEAKRREGARPRIGGLFNGALSKNAKHQRIVFIDINQPDDATGERASPYLDKALRQLRSFEGKVLRGHPRPSAYVFVTNTPWAHCLDAPVPRCIAISEGFQITEFKSDFRASSLRRLIDAREAHIEMHELIKSLRDHFEIPATFDGEMAEYAFNPQMKRILIGQRYLLCDHDGVERPAEVTSANVWEEERVALCAVLFDDGRTVIYRMPLSDEEMAAWKRHPDTFFGVVGQRSTRADTPLEFYDFFHESCKRQTKEKLLLLMHNEPDIRHLSELDQSRLAGIYSERMTIAAFSTVTAQGIGVGNQIVKVQMEQRQKRP